MKYFIFSLFITVICSLSVKAQVSDDFSDGDFTANPAWSGDAAKFEVNAAKQLHLNAPAVTDTAYLSTANTLMNDVEWDFFFTMDFSPSASNFLKVFLASDQANLKQPLNGYFLKMGEDGTDDAIDLYLKQGSTETMILQGIAGRVAAGTNSVSVKVTRDAAGNWAVYSDTTGGTNYTLEGTVQDNNITTTGYFGFYCKYTSTRSTLYYFDNVFTGIPVPDLTPPQFNSVEVKSANQLDLHFSEALDAASAQDVNLFSVDNGIGNPSVASLDANDHSLIHLTFASSFQPAVTNTITVSDVSDPAGNILLSASLPFTFFQAQPGDVIINELMPDPSPVIALPDAEYIELYNRSAAPADLTGWQLSDGSSTATLSLFTLLPDSFLIVCPSSSASLFSPYGNVMGVATFPSLNNDGDDVTLLDAGGNVVNEVLYDLSWYHDDVKSQGGYSLERIDPASPCEGGANWHASNDAKGGTPGKKNSDLSAFADTTAPHLTHAAAADASTITLYFDEAVDATTASDISNYQVMPAPPEVLSATPAADLMEVTLTLSQPLDSNMIYVVTAGGLSDCMGNVMQQTDSAVIAIPSVIQPGNILINEILYNPQSGGYDYVELFNNTQKVFDLKDLWVATADDDDSITALTSVTSDSYLLLPGEYVVLTENADWVKANYYAQNPDWFINTTLPSYNDDEGRVLIVNAQKERVDELRYSDKWQFALLNSSDGVALERINPDAATQDSLNWHSAASTAGYGTPTYKNSQFNEPVTGNEITLSPQVFSPDQDGFNDVLSIAYQFTQAGYTANIKIFDTDGRIIRNLARNVLLAQSGTITWDGITDEGEKARLGMYIVYSEIFDLSGTVKRYKNVCVVAGKKS